MQRSLVTGLPRLPRAAVTAYWVAVLLGLAVYGVHLTVGFGTAAEASSFFDDWLYSAIGVSGALLVLARVALVRQERLAWTLIGLAVLSWATADIIWWQAFSTADEIPYPSVADALYILFFPLVYAGLIVLLRARVRRFHASMWLDGIAAALIIAGVGGAVLLPPILDSSEGASAVAIATNLAYPLGDLLVLGVAVALAGLLGWRPGPAIGLLITGCLAFTFADGVYLFQVAGDGYVEGGVLDFIWPLGITCISLAAWQPLSLARSARLEGRRVMLLPSLVVVTAISLLVFDHYVPRGGFAVWLAAGALLVCMGRAGLTFRENITQAGTDALTGLPNRLLFGDRAEQAVLRARRHGARAAIMIIDLDRFKEVNDTLGHASGDVMLLEIARRLRATLRESDTVARLGGDEFAVLLPGVQGAEGAERVAAALSEEIARPVMVDGLSLDTEASIGIALFPDHGADVAELLQRADVAMYTAKAESLPFAFYGREQDEHSPERLTLVTDLRRAMEQDELVLHYQPKVDLETGALAGIEALVRWQHPDRGLLGPGDFVPVAEQTALIRPLTLHVIDRALEQCARWSAEARDLRVSVNVSARNLLDVHFADGVAEALERWGIRAGRLELEITETALMANPSRALEVLRGLDALGVALSIDDFGAGYTSLNYLKTLPVGVLKIDRSFVGNMATDPADAMIVRSTIDLARNLGLRVVAEGIEDAATYEALKGLGCALGQGFHIARPMAADALQEWLRERCDPGSPRDGSRAVARPAR